MLAGSLGLTGAAYLSATAAARTGAGLVRLLVADTIYPILAAKVITYQDWWGHIWDRVGGHGWI